MQNRVTIQINGQKYSISTQEEPGYVLGLSREIDLQLSGLMRDNRKLSVAQGMVLLLLNYMDRAKKAEENADRMRKQVTGYASDDGKARGALEQSNRRLKALEQELAENKNKMAEQKRELEALRKQKNNSKKEQIKMAEA